MFWKVVCVSLKYVRQMGGERKSFCNGQGFFSPIPLAVLAVYRVVRYRRKGVRGSPRIYAPPSHVMGNGKDPENSQVRGEAIRFAQGVCRSVRGPRGWDDIKSRFLAAGICFPGHLCFMNRQSRGFVSMPGWNIHCLRDAGRYLSISRREKLPDKGLEHGSTPVRQPSKGITNTCCTFAPTKV